MDNFKNWLSLNEGMSIYVADRDYRNDLNNIDDLAEYLKRKVYYPLENKLSKEQINKLRTGGSAGHGIIAPDGSYYHGEDQVINFYTSGLEEFVPTILKGIKYYLDELKVKYGQFKEEKSNMFKSNVIRIPILQFNTSKNTPPLMNLSNQNAFELFGNILKFKFDNENGTFDDIPVGELYRRIEGLEQDQIQLHARDPYTTKYDKGATFHYGGQNEEDIKRKLEQIKKIAKWAMDNHYDKIKLI